MQSHYERPLTRKELAAFLTEHGFKTAPAYLAKLASVGGGPPFFSYGRRPLYPPSRALEWARSRCTGLRRSTSDPGQPAAA
jgi:hypothetical protein